MKQQSALIAKANGVKHLHSTNGNTHDIIKSILYADGFCAPYTVNLSKTLAEKDLYKTCRNIWQFWKDNVKYVEDPDGYQYIKSPGYLYQVGKTDGGDCKSYSVAVASCLKNLGINYCYRFISEYANKEFHHVYVVVPSPNGEIVIDCVLDSFDSENSFEKKQDIVPSKLPSKIGALDPTASDSYWVAQINDYRTNIESIKSNVKTRLKNGIGFYFSGQPLRKNKCQKMIDENWDQLMQSACSMMYHFWDHNQAQFPGAYYGATSVNNASAIFGNLTAKRDYGMYIYEALVAAGCREGDIRDLCSLSVFNIYGIPLDYMLYRCYNTVNYGQPWKPVPGVPYWDYRVNQFKANGATNDDVLLIAFALPYGGGVGRPYGTPYWAAGGWVMPNGATDTEANNFRNRTTQPNNIQLDDATIQRSVQLYNSWINGNLPGLPEQGRKNAKIGDPGVSAIVGIVVACITALSVILSIVATIINMVKKQPEKDKIAEPIADFKMEYQTVDGCYIGNAPAECGSQKAKYCPDGSFTCLTDVQINLPENQPSAGNFSGLPPASTGWLALAGTVLIALGLSSSSNK